MVTIPSTSPLRLVRMSLSVVLPTAPSDLIIHHPRLSQVSKHHHHHHHHPSSSSSHFPFFPPPGTALDGYIREDDEEKRDEDSGRPAGQRESYLGPSAPVPPPARPIPPGVNPGKHNRRANRQMTSELQEVGWGTYPFSVKA